MFPAKICTKRQAIRTSNTTMASRSRSTQEESFYDVLGANALPIGLFPKGISNFSRDPSSDSFHVQLLAPSFETRVRYQGDISGKLSYGRIANLTGVAAKELFLWLPVRGIQVDIPSSGLFDSTDGVVFDGGRRSSAYY